MTIVNEFYKIGKINKAEFKTFLTLLNPFAPHITEELNKIAGFEADISTYAWPEYDESKTVDDEITLPIQFNGKLKATINIAKNLAKDEVEKLVHENEKVQKLLEDKNVIKEIYVPNKIYNIVVK